ncbi:hypothetical protein B4168_1449 [Anoxybacillus flavithermus]|nr:hypothetical protein B4168_1449 [Anoxybacillus flavithermus]OAO84106.1 hypothetical protein GT23_3641 [Parageobacillus thermoglucosidasius]
MFHLIPPFPFTVYCYRSLLALFLFDHNEKRVPLNSETR